MPSRKTLLRILTAAMVVVMLASVAVIAATAGTDSDPLVTRSYLEGPYKKTLLSDAESAAESQVETLERSLDKRIQSFTSNLSGRYADAVFERRCDHGGGGPHGRDGRHGPGHRRGADSQPLLCGVRRLHPAGRCGDQDFDEMNTESIGLPHTICGRLILWSRGLLVLSMGPRPVK